MPTWIVGAEKKETDLADFDSMASRRILLTCMLSSQHL